MYINCHDHGDGRITERQQRILKLIEKIHGR